MEKGNELPEDWRLVRLGEACIINMGQSPPSETYNYNGIGLPFFQGKAEFTDLYPVVEKWCSVPKKIAEPYDILLSVRAPVGTTNIADQKCSIGRGLASLRFENYKYGFYFLRSIEQQLDSKGTGTTFRAISGEVIRETLIPLPPISTQHLIVAKIEELFSEIDKGIENLKLAQQQLKVYRQSVLKWAFEGKLTNKNVKEGELPKGWKVETLGNIFEVFVGATPKRNNPLFWNGNVNWVSSSEVAFCKISKTKETISQEGLDNSSCKIHPIGTVIIAMIGEGKTRGQVAILKVEASHNQNSAAIRIPEQIYKSELLYYFLVLKYQENRKIGSGNNQKALNKERVKNIEFPLFSIEEQAKVYQEIESRLSVADKLEETITQSLQHAEALKQSVFKKAFEGKLVVEKKKEIVKPKNVYFSQVQLLALITTASKKHNISHGEMTLAKYAYLLDKAYHITTDYNFKRLHLGPYPIEMKKAINNKEFFSISKNIEVVNEEKLLKYKNLYADQITDAVNDLATIFSQYDIKERPHKTELLATVCKVVEDIQSLDLSLVRQSMQEWPIELKNSTFKNKAEKFTEEETKKCLAFISYKGWDKKLI